MLSLRLAFESYFDLSSRISLSARRLLLLVFFSLVFLVLVSFHFLLVFLALFFPFLFAVLVVVLVLVSFLPDCYFQYIYL